MTYDVYADIQQICIFPSDDALDQVCHAGCSPKLVREMLAVLELVDCLWIELNLTQNRVFAFLGRKQHVHMEIEWTLALANLILHPNDLEMVRRLDALIGAHKILGGLADERRTHHIRHELRIWPLILFFAVLGDFYGNTIGALRWPDLELHCFDVTFSISVVQ